MKALKRSLIVLLILGLSLGIGLAVDRICDAIDRSSYPQKYSEFVTEYSALYGVPEQIVYAVIKTESGFSSSAVSSAGAIGLMQIMPDTFDFISMMLQSNYEVGMLNDPQTNIRYGTYYLSYLFDKFGHWETVYAAYNAGPGRVAEWQQDSRYSDENGLLTDIPYPETRNYIKKVTKAAEMYARLYY